MPNDKKTTVSSEKKRIDPLELKKVAGGRATFSVANPNAQKSDSDHLKSTRQKDQP